MEKEINFKELRVFAEKIRLETLKEFQCLGFGHVGGALSVIEALAVLYGKVMKIDPKNPKWEDRDYMVMSKGHAGPAVYATLALKGYFPIEQLKTLNKPGTNLPSHCDKNRTIGVDMTTGSLGQGVSAALGIAHGVRMSGKDSWVYLFVGDGECDEGQVWEGALSAAHHKLDNLVMFIDYNKQQLDGYIDDILTLGDIEAKMNSFGWDTYFVDGHSLEEIYAAIESSKQVKGKPHAIILNTSKGRGCDLVEGKRYNHHVKFKAEDMQRSIDAAEKAVREAEAAL